MKKNNSIKLSFFLGVLLLFKLSFAATGDYVLTKSEKIGGDGRTWEQQETMMKEYYDSNYARNYSWSAGSGSALLKVEQDGPSGTISRNFNASYGIPSVVEKDSTVSIPISLGGSIANWPAEWAQDPSVGTLDFYVYTGNDLAKMNYLGQKGFSTVSGKTLSDKYEFKPRANNKYIIIYAVAGNGLVSGVGMSYVYEVGGILEKKELDKPVSIKPTTKCPTKKDSGTRFSSISGTVEVTDEESIKEDSWWFAKYDMVLCVDDHVKTGEESRAILSFSDMSTFTMKEETHIVLNSPPDKDNKIALVWGKIKANVKKMIKDGSMEIDMSQAVAGIKGTTFILEDDGKNSIIKVIEGTVEFTSKITGAKEMVGAGEKVVASASGLSQKESFDITLEDKEWEVVESGLSNLYFIAIVILFVIIALFGYKRFF